MTATFPPPYHLLHRHDLLPKADHDESARFNFLANLNAHIGAKLFPGVAEAFKARVEPGFKAQAGRDFADRIEVRTALSRDPAYQTWSALRRTTMEMRHQAGRAVSLRQIEQLNARAAALNGAGPNLKLDPSVPVPTYIADVDNHCAPGSYYTEILPGDVSAAASYEAGHYVTVSGGTGTKSDAIGRTVARYVRAAYPAFQPKRIVDLGASAGFNTLPIAEAFPEAEIIALDIAAPFLRYGHARTKLMGIDNITFVQGDGETYPIEPGSVDWVQTTMFWHETSAAALRAMFKRIYTWLRPGGLFLNMEQPNFDAHTTLFEQAIKDWDSWYNGEPFWAKLHSMDVRAEMADAGFDPAGTFEVNAPHTLDEPSYPSWAKPVSRHAHEHKLRDDARTSDPATQRGSIGGGLYLFGALK